MAVPAKELQEKRESIGQNPDFHSWDIDRFAQPAPKPLQAVIGSIENLFIPEQGWQVDKIWAEQKSREPSGNIQPVKELFEKGPSLISAGEVTIYLRLKTTRAGVPHPKHDIFYTDESVIAVPRTLKPSCSVTWAEQAGRGGLAILGISPIGPFGDEKQTRVYESGIFFVDNSTASNTILVNEYLPYLSLNIKYPYENTDPIKGVLFVSIKLRNILKVLEQEDLEMSEKLRKSTELQARLRQKYLK